MDDDLGVRMSGRSGPFPGIGFFYRQAAALIIEGFQGCPAEWKQCLIADAERNGIFPVDSKLVVSGDFQRTEIEDGTYLVRPFGRC